MLYLSLQVSAIIEDLSKNSSMVYIENFPGFGRIPIIARIASDFDIGQEPLWPNVLLLLLGVVALLWGYRVSRRVKSLPIELPLMSLAGSLIFLINTFIAGFGFGYKGAFLLLTVPLVSFIMIKSDGFMRYTALVLVSFLSISLFVTYSILLTSLVSIFGSFIILGISIGAIVRGKLRFVSSANHDNTA